MRLLRLLQRLDPRDGGTVESARQIDAELRRQGHEVEVVCRDTPGQPWLASYPATVHALGPARLNYGYCGALVPWLRSHRRRFDAVIVDGLWQYQGVAAWRALAGTDTPYFVYTHGMLGPWYKHHRRLKHLKKWLYWPWADYRLLRDARAVLFTCEEERRVARKSFWLYRANEVVASLGLARPPQDARLSEAFRAAYPETRGKRVLLFLGRIHAIKGCDLLIEAFAALAPDHPDLHLVMAGPAPCGLASALRQVAAQRGIAERISWTGMLQGDAKWGAYHAADAFCLPSHHENFGMVVAEALGCATPVLISDKINIWREIEADGAGIVRTDTLAGTIAALQSWLDMDAQECGRMREAARRSFESRYLIERVAADLTSILEQQLRAAVPAQLEGALYESARSPRDPGESNAPRCS